MWRVTWNVTGTMLASTGDDGYVRMWRMNYQKGWKCVCSFKPDQGTHVAEGVIASNMNNLQSSTTKYFKRGATHSSTQISQH